MKCLTVLNPWAVLLVSGDKKEEWRGWNAGYRGPIFIHSSKSKELLTAPEMREARENLPFGALLGLVVIADCASVKGSWKFVIERPHPLPEPVYCSGCLGLWELSSEVQAKVGREVVQLYERLSHEYRDRQRAARLPAKEVVGSR